MAHTELGLRERRTIEDMLNAKISVDKIAAEIGRHRSNVFREIKRNGIVKLLSNAEKLAVYVSSCGEFIHVFVPLTK
jgi:IS30 family transposase